MCFNFQRVLSHMWFPAKCHEMLFHASGCDAIAWSVYCTVSFVNPSLPVAMAEVELSCVAYVKMYLHASLFPHCSVNGLLLSPSPPGADVCITDCVPLLHSHLPLTPITQVALTQVGWHSSYHVFVLIERRTFMDAFIATDGCVYVAC